MIRNKSLETKISLSVVFGNSCNLSSHCVGIPVRIPLQHEPGKASLVTSVSSHGTFENCPKQSKVSKNTKTRHLCHAGTGKALQKFK